MEAESESLRQRLDQLSSKRRRVETTYAAEEKMLQEEMRRAVTLEEETKRQDSIRRSKAEEDLRHKIQRRLDTVCNPSESAIRPSGGKAKPVKYPKLEGIKRALQKLPLTPNKGKKGVNLLTLCEWSAEKAMVQDLPSEPTEMGGSSSCSKEFTVFDPATIPSEFTSQFHDIIPEIVEVELGVVATNVEDCARALRRLSLRVEETALERLDDFRNQNLDKEFPEVEYRGDFKLKNRAKRKTVVAFYVRQRAAEMHRAGEVARKVISDMFGEPQAFLDNHKVVGEILDFILDKLWWLLNLNKEVSMESKRPKLRF